MWYWNASSESNLLLLTNNELTGLFLQHKCKRVEVAPTAAAQLMVPPPVVTAYLQQTLVCLSCGGSKAKILSDCLNGYNAGFNATCGLNMSYILQKMIDTCKESIQGKQVKQVK